MLAYLPILIESAHAASIIPLASEATAYAMKAFGGFNMELAFALSVIGGTLGHAFNWGVGALLARWKGANGEVHARAQRIFKKYLIFLLLFCWFPVMNFAVVASGFLGVRLKTALPLIALGLAGYYGAGLLS